MTTGFGFVTLGRCIRETFTTWNFGAEQREQVLRELCPAGPECVYCGSPDVGRWDHLYPVAEGGDTVIGNMVPACPRRDDSKGQRPYRQWMLGDARYSPKTRGVPDLEARLARIDAYVAAHAYRPVPVEERLTPEEAAELARLREAMALLRRDLDALVGRYREPGEKG
jgi:hypothetical protein